MSGGNHTITAALAYDTYTDATYDYFGEAPPGSAVTDPNWRVSRQNKVTTKIEWADGNGNFDNVFTDLVTVAAFSYS